MMSSHALLSLSKEQLVDRVLVAEERIRWFERHVFGEKSERRDGSIVDPRQLSLGESSLETIEVPAPTESVKSYQRRTKKEALEEGTDAGGLRFGPEVPVHTIELENPSLSGLAEGADYEIVSEKVTHRLAQRPSSYVVLRYVRKVAKLLKTETLSCPPAPAAVFERSYADVSFIAGLLVEKFAYHLPLYRQHERLNASGITLSRQTLTNLVLRAGELLTPIYHSQLSSILQSKVLAMDETPIKAGRLKPGSMKTAYFWPVYGDKDEVAFPFSTSREHKTVEKVLGRFSETLLTDGYAAYVRFAEKHSVTHAQCSAHTRRNFVEAEKLEPELVDRALSFIRTLYQNEEAVRTRGLSPEEVLAHRTEYSRPVVDGFFDWLEEQCARLVLLPSSPFLAAASYALERRRGLTVFLADPAVPLDTNHLERALRPIPLGRKNWLFCWTESGAETVGRVQSLIATCKIHGIDPFTYLVDVLQRMDSHPVVRIDEITPRRWKECFGDAPLRSDVEARTPHISRLHSSRCFHKCADNVS